MSLTDSLLLVPVQVPGEVWIALRPTSQLGSGSEADPFNGATLNNISSRLSATLTSNGTATVTVVTSVNHGYRTGDIILIEGLDPIADYRLLGPFSITIDAIDPKKFTIVTFETVASATKSGTCRPDPYLFDVVMRALPQIPTVLRLGPGTFETKGYADSLGGVLSSTAPLSSWRPWSGLKMRGSGMGVTTLKLVQASYLNRAYSAIGMPTMSNPFTPLVGFEASDFTIDAAIASQPSPNVTCAALFIRGNDTRIRRIRAINFGRQGDPFNQTQECFVIGVAGSEYVTSLTDGQRVNCVVEDCIVEWPGLRSVRETTCIQFFMDQTALVSGSPEVRVQGLTAFHQSCVIRNNYVNCDYVENAVGVSNITAPSAGVSTVTTLTPHGLNNGDWFRLHGAYVASDGGYDNGFVGSFQVVTRVDSNHFTYTPTDPIPTVAPMPGSEM